MKYYEQTGEAIFEELDEATDEVEEIKIKVWLRVYEEVLAHDYGDTVAYESTTDYEMDAIEIFSDDKYLKEVRTETEALEFLGKKYEQTIEDAITNALEGGR